MASTIKIKNSSTAGAVPTSSDLVQGELAINVTDRRIFTENASGTVVELGTPSIDDNGNATAITIDSSENVGIGTSSPAAKLAIVGPTGNGMYYSDGTVVNYLGTTASSRAESGTTTNHPYSFITYGVERARIDSSGNLLVGTTSVFNSSRLSVEGAAGLGATVRGTGTVMRVGVNGAGGATLIAFRSLTDSYDCGNITTDTANTVYSTSSDYRLKENVTPLSGALEKVALLKPVSWTWKHMPNLTSEGFIAHELQEVCPDAVTGEKDAVDAEGNPQYQGIDTSFLVATLTAAIQELKATVDAQAARITALEQA